MSQLGTFLREKREAQGITLEELQARTKIRIRYLEAIEAGDFAAIPGEVYLRGFIRSIARELDIDPQEAMDLYFQDNHPATETVDQPGAMPQTPAVTEEKSKEVNVGKPKEVAAEPAPVMLERQPASLPPRPANRSRSRKKKKKAATVIRLFWLLVLAGLIVGGIFFWDRFFGPGPIANEPNVPTPNNEQEEPTPDPEPEEPQVVVELQNPGERNPIFHVTPGPIEIVMTAEGGACWIGASADGGAQQQMTLTPGGQNATLTVQAEREIVVRVGNPSALRLIINGIDQGIIGGEPRGIDLTVRLTPGS